jgi:hypothetical protein
MVSGCHHINDDVLQLLKELTFWGISKLLMEVVIRDAYPMRVIPERGPRRRTRPLCYDFMFPYESSELAFLYFAHSFSYFLKSLSSIAPILRSANSADLIEIGGSTI